MKGRDVRGEGIQVRGGFRRRWGPRLVSDDFKGKGGRDTGLVEKGWAGRLGGGMGGYFVRQKNATVATRENVFSTSLQSYVI